MITYHATKKDAVEREVANRLRGAGHHPGWFDTRKLAKAVLGVTPDNKWYLAVTPDEFWVAAEQARCVPTRTEVDAMVTGTDDPVTRLMIRLGTEAGLRPAETITLRRDAVTGRRGAHHLSQGPGKGGNRRNIPISDDLAETIRTIDGGDQYVFGRAGEAANPTRVSTEVIRRLRPTLPAGMSVHALRHHYLVHAAE